MFEKLSLEEFEKREAKQTIAFLRAALQIPDDSYRHWLSQRSMLNHYTVSPKCLAVAFCSPCCRPYLLRAAGAADCRLLCSAVRTPLLSTYPAPTTAPNHFLLVVEFVLWAGRWSPSIEYEYW